MRRFRLADLVLVTGNPNKVREAERIAGAEIESVAIDLPEIQSMDLAEVLRIKGEEAWRRTGRAVIVEETGLELPAMNGFPGPMVKWMIDSIGPEGLADAAIRLGDPRAIARCMLLVTDGDETLTAEGTANGTLVLPARGDTGFGWDPVFQPDGHERTSAELGDEVKDRISHRGRAWQALLAQLD